jgi:hypothetical protein
MLLENMVHSFRFLCCCFYAQWTLDDQKSSLGSQPCREQVTAVPGAQGKNPVTGGQTAVYRGDWVCG